MLTKTDIPFPPDLIDILYDGIKPRVMVYVTRKDMKVHVKDGVIHDVFTQKYSPVRIISALAFFAVAYTKWGMGEDQMFLFDRDEMAVYIGSMDDIERIDSDLFKGQWTSKYMSKPSLCAVIYTCKVMENIFKTREMYRKETDDLLMRFRKHVDWVDSFLD